MEKQVKSIEINMASALEMRRVNTRLLMSLLLTSELGEYNEDQDYQNIGIRSVLKGKLSKAISKARDIDSDEVFIHNLNQEELLSLKIDLYCEDYKFTKEMSETLDASILPTAVAIRNGYNAVNEAYQEFRSEPTETEMNS